MWRLETLSHVPDSGRRVTDQLHRTRAAGLGRGQHGRPSVEVAGALGQHCGPRLSADPTLSAGPSWEADPLEVSLPRLARPAQGRREEGHCVGLAVTLQDRERLKMQ